MEKTKRGSIGNRGTVPLTGRSAILGEKRTNNFLDVAFGKGEMVKLQIITSLPYFGVKLSRVCLKVTYSIVNIR